MHVGLLTRLFPPESTGGTEAVVLAQARALLERGHRVDVVCGTDTPLPRGGVEVLHDAVLDVRVHRLPRTAAERGADPLEVRPRLRDLALELLGGAELVHLHHWQHLDLSLVRAFAPRVPVVVTLHDAFPLCPLALRRAPNGVACPEDGTHAACARWLALDADVAPAELEAGLDRRASAFRAELGAASLLVAPSRTHALRLAPAAAGRAIRIVPHGLCAARGRLPAAPRPQLPAKLVVAHFGNLSSDVGTLDLVRTLSLVPRERVELRVAGPVLDPAVERALSAHRRANLVRMGPYDAASLAAFLSGSHLAAFPSRRELGYGLCVDEALAMGLPVWASDRGAPAERLSAWGLPGRLLPARDPLAWAAALRSVLEAPHTLFEERARVPQSLPTAVDAARLLEEGYERVLARRAA
jgi:glycosyltransferase involved in cell wall biosynthesis